jgi:hypothetical protein
MKFIVIKNEKKILIKNVKIINFLIDKKKAFIFNIK